MPDLWRLGGRKERKGGNDGGARVGLWLVPAAPVPFPLWQWGRGGGGDPHHPITAPPPPMPSPQPHTHPKDRGFFFFSFFLFVFMCFLEKKKKKRRNVKEGGVGGPRGGQIFGGCAPPIPSLPPPNPPPPSPPRCWAQFPGGSSVSDPFSFIFMGIFWVFLFCLGGGLGVGGGRGGSHRVRRRKMRRLSQKRFSSNIANRSLWKFMSIVAAIASLRLRSCSRFRAISRC